MRSVLAYCLHCDGVLSGQTVQICQATRAMTVLKQVALMAEAGTFPEAVDENAHGIESARMQITHKKRDLHALDVHFVNFYFIPNPDYNNGNFNHRMACYIQFSIISNKVWTIVSSLNSNKRNGEACLLKICILEAQRMLGYGKTFEVVDEMWSLRESPAKTGFSFFGKTNKMIGTNYLYPSCEEDLRHIIGITDA